MKRKYYLIVLALILSISGLRMARAEDPATNTTATEQAPVVSTPTTDQMQSVTTTPEISSAPITYTDAANSVQKKLEASLTELSALRDQIASEKIPLSQKLNDLENQLIKVRMDYQQASRLLDSRTLDLNNLRTEIKSRQDEAAYVSNLLGEYIRNFESRLHIAEMQRYQSLLVNAKLAPENSNISQEEIFHTQTSLVVSSINRLNDALGGSEFEGKAVVASGIMEPGTFLLVGPTALFKSKDGKSVGTVEQRLGSLEPAVIGFEKPENTDAAVKVITKSEGNFPFDPTMGNAHKVESTKTSLFEHIRMGGPIMFPILLLGFSALTVALMKWNSLRTVQSPSQQKIMAIMNAVAKRDHALAFAEAKSLGGPTGKMLVAGIEQIESPLELIEEVMHEVVLSTRLKLLSKLPFIALSATAAPLLGLLGTVTGIITTFGLITVFGSGDPKTLSGGISEALIGTEFGLYVAIPSLLLHAFLSRKARGVIDQMEKVGVTFINQISKSRLNAMNNPAKRN